MTHYKDQLLACDFFTVETLFLQTIYVLILLKLGADGSTLRIAPPIRTTPGHPASAPGDDSLDERGRHPLSLIRDNDRSSVMLLTRCSVRRASR
jgi:hypothetical protein